MDIGVLVLVRLTRCLAALTVAGYAVRENVKRDLS